MKRKSLRHPPLMNGLRGRTYYFHDRRRQGPGQERLRFHTRNRRDFPSSPESRIVTIPYGLEPPFLFQFAMRSAIQLSLFWLPIMALVIGCNNSESIPAAYRGVDGTYYGSEPANLTVVISNHGQNWRATGTLPWGESANFSGIIDENGNMINNATGFKSGKVTVYGDYVSSVYLMNYRVWRKGEEAWHEKNNAQKQAIRDDNVSRLFKGIGNCREYAHEFQRDDESYLSLLKISDDGIIDNYVVDSKTGRIVGLSTITVSDDKNELYRSDEIGIYDSPVFFKFSVSKNGLRFKDNGWIADYKPARQEQIQLLSPILSPPKYIRVKGWLLL